MNAPTRADEATVASVQKALPEPVYGYCTACRSIEVALNRVDGTRNFSGIGEAADYPAGYGCEVCS